MDEALSVSRELKNDGMVAETLGVQGDMFFYAGDLKSAHPPTRRHFRRPGSKEPDTILIAKAKLAKVEVQEKRGRKPSPVFSP